MFICCSPYIVNESNLGLVFCGKALILSLNFTIINIYFVFYQKKKKGLDKRILKKLKQDLTLKS